MSEGIKNHKGSKDLGNQGCEKQGTLENGVQHLMPLLPWRNLPMGKGNGQVEKSIRTLNRLIGLGNQKIFAKYNLQGLVSRIYNELPQISMKKTDSPIQKWAKKSSKPRNK